MGGFDCVTIASGATCTLACQNGFTKSGDLTCTAGSYDTQTCNANEAQVSAAGGDEAKVGSNVVTEEEASEKEEKMPIFLMVILVSLCLGAIGMAITAIVSRRTKKEKQRRKQLEKEKLGLTDNQESAAIRILEYREEVATKKDIGSSMNLAPSKDTDGSAANRESANIDSRTVAPEGKKRERTPYRIKPKEQKGSIVVDQIVGVPIQIVGNTNSSSIQWNKVILIVSSEG